MMLVTEVKANYSFPAIFLKVRTDIDGIARHSDPFLLQICKKRQIERTEITTAPSDSGGQSLQLK